MGETLQSRLRAHRCWLPGGAAAAAVAIAGPAMADCTPYPTQASTTTRCTGANSGGLTVDVPHATFLVEAGASVTGGAPAAVSAISHSFGFYSDSNTVVANGLIDGLGNVGVLIAAASGSSGFFFGSNVNVGAAGAITGSTGILVGSGGAATESVYTSIDNAGSITATSGPALRSGSGRRSDRPERSSATSRLRER